jgi:glycosyltransferase involved in cell wall biosynthesis
MQRPDLVVLNDWPTGLAGGMADEPGRIPTLSIIHNAFDYALGDVPLEAFETSSQVPEKHLPGFYFTEAHMEKGDVALSGRKEREIDDPASGKGKKKIITECLIGLGAALHASLVMGVSPTFVSMMLNSGNTFPGLRDILRIKDFFRSLFGVSHGLNPYEGSEPVETPEQRQRLMTARKDAKELLFEETGLMEQIHDRARDEMRASGRPTSGPEFDREIQSRLKAPTLAIVSRLDAYQKGFDLLMAPVRPEDPRSPSVLEALLDQGVRIVVHGPKGGSADFTAFLERLSHDARYRGQVAFLTGFDLSDEPMIRNVARAREITYDHPLLKLKDLVFQLDGFLLPSREEPFGMTMLEALRDGTPLIGSTNGGPLDILGALDARVHPHGIGFLFGHLWAHGDDPAYQALLPHLKDYTAQGFYETLQDWLAIYHQPERWEQLVVDAKNYRRTWKDATREFLEFVIPRIRPDLAGKLLKPIDRAPRALFAGA